MEQIARDERLASSCARVIKKKISFEEQLICFWYFTWFWTPDLLKVATGYSN
jgi:hypothetical protein